MSSVPAQSVQPAEPTGITVPVLTNAKVIRAEVGDIFTRRKEVARAIEKFVRAQPDLKIKIEKEDYAKAPVWTFCAACFGVTIMVTLSEELLTDDRQEMGYHAIANAIDANGRVISTADAACMCSESDWAGKPSFQLRSMSETRAATKVCSLLYKDVMVLAGFSPTPAEEMNGASGPRRDREITTPCNDCGNKVSKKRALTSRRQWGKEICLDCEKILKEREADGIMAPLADAAKVSEHITKVKQRKANGGQPIVAALDAGKDDVAV